MDTCWVDTPGSEGGTVVIPDTIAAITLESGDVAINYWFSELDGDLPATR